jgi:hypothetical protein
MNLTLIEMVLLSKAIGLSKSELAYAVTKSLNHVKEEERTLGVAIDSLLARNLLSKDLSTYKYRISSLGTAQLKKDLDELELAITSIRKGIWL